MTVSQSLVYTIRFPQIQIPSSHQYITIKFNAVLLNQQNSQSLKILVISSTQQRIFDNTVTANQTELQCYLNNVLTNVGKSFYVSLSISTSTPTLLISITTLNVNDQLGLSSILIYYGNCYEGCASCTGQSMRQCTKCTNLLKYQADTNQCIGCPDGFYMIGRMCLPCPYQCRKCQYNVTLNGNVNVTLNGNVNAPVCTQCQSQISSNVNISAPACLLNNVVYVQANTTKFTSTSIINTGWSSSAVPSQNIITQCGIYSLLGGIPSGLGGSILTRTLYNLPVHNILHIKFNVMLIDQQPSTQFNLYINVDGAKISNVVINVDSSVMSSNECGTQEQEFVYIYLKDNVQHTSSNVKVDVQGLGNYWGIRDFVIVVKNVTDDHKCAQVRVDGQSGESRCVRCQNGYAINSSTTTTSTVSTSTVSSVCVACPPGTYQYSTNSSYSVCVPCSIYCKTCSSSPTKCSSCDSPLIYQQKSAACIDANNNLYAALMTSSSSSNSIQNVDSQWQIYPKIPNKGLTKCSSRSLIGSTQLVYRNLKMSRTFHNLPTHTGITIHMHIYQIDNYNTTETLTFKLNNHIYNYTISQNGYNLCGNQTYDTITKTILTDPTHSTQSLTLQIQANNVKVGVNDILLFVSNCDDGCQRNGVGYSVETMPLYSGDMEGEQGMKSKIVFSQHVSVGVGGVDLRRLFQVRLVNSTSSSSSSTIQTVSQTDNNNNTDDSFSTGEKDPYQILSATLLQNKQLILFQNLLKDQYNKTAIATVLAPDQVYSIVQNTQIAKSLRLSPVYGNFSRYDNIDSILDADGPQYRPNIRNFMNFFRGITILALFIGLLSFFIHLSQVLDDLFLLCQLIFVHIFINSQWLAVTLKLPLSAMQLVQFMAWLPLEARSQIQKAIIPSSNHYQYSPIVYEQYWKDITFVRCIYHVVIFLVVIMSFYWLIRLINSLRQPTVNNIMQISNNNNKYRYIQLYYYTNVKKWFVFVERVIRFTFFTVIWACLLQFIHFQVKPASFMGWNATLCIIFFVFYVLYVGVGYWYLKRQAGIMQALTYKQKFDGIRINRQRLWYFIFKYIKLLVIAVLISQLYSVNPLACLIPLIFVHIVDACVLVFFKPFIKQSGQSQRIVSKCSKIYWSYYLISHIIQNLLFMILQLILIIMYSTRSTANKQSYLSTGYAACAFIVLLLVNGVVRVVWGIFRVFQLCFQQIKTERQRVESEDDIGPLKYLDLYRANNNGGGNGEGLVSERRDNRIPSIQAKTRGM